MIIRFVDIEGIINHHCLSFLSTNYLNAKILLTTYQQDMSDPGSMQCCGMKCLK